MRVLCGGTVDENLFSRLQAENAAKATYHGDDRRIWRMKINLVIAKGLWTS